jgi:hypothetical protein
MAVFAIGCTTSQVPDESDLGDAELLVLEAATGFGLSGGALPGGEVDPPGADPVDPLEPADLLSCLDLPSIDTDPETGELIVDSAALATWLSERLVYHAGTCFAGWTVSIAIEDCQVRGQLVDGSVMLAGEAMAAVPETGLFIQVQAAAAAVVDVLAFAAGEGQAYVDLAVDGSTVSLAACSAPSTDGARIGELGFAFETSLLGSVTVNGSIVTTRTTDLRTTSYQMAVDATPPGLPALRGEILANGLERLDSMPCPHSGEVVFTGIIHDEAAEVRLVYVAAGTVVITLPDGSEIGPFTPTQCAVGAAE